jgi:uncharacterized membrane protein
MFDDGGPVFRKPITPWYHSRLTYVAVILTMLTTFFFGMAGVRAAREVAAYHDYLWVPVLLMILSGAVAVTVTIRLIHSYAAK